MTTNPRQQTAEATRLGVNLGLFMGHALLAPPLAIYCILTGHPLLAALFVVAGVIGFLGWKRDYNLAWTITSKTFEPTPPQ